jgi:hypothetical protein
MENSEIGTLEALQLIIDGNPEINDVDFLAWIEPLNVEVFFE